MDSPIREIMTGGLSDYDKTKEVAAITPLIELLVKQLEKINVPASLVIGTGLHSKEDGLGMTLSIFSLGRKENGKSRSTGLMQAIDVLTNDRSGNITLNVLTIDKLEKLYGSFGDKNPFLGDFGNGMFGTGITSKPKDERQKTINRIINNYEEGELDGD